MMACRFALILVLIALVSARDEQDPPGVSAALALLQTRTEAYLDDALQLLRFPTVSALPEHLPDIAAAAGWLVARLERAGLENVRLLNTTGPRPVVYADWLRAEGAPTALIYGHYDVQPADPLELWTTPPFEPDVREGHIWARGADDDKGNLLPPIQAAEAVLAATGRLPMNLKFVLEGEEEIGSPFLEPFLTAHAELLRGDFVVSADGSQLGPKSPGVVLGMRGAVAAEIEVTALGTDVHSGLAGGAVQNPIRALAQILASLHFPNGSVAVPGFYADVRPITQEDRDDMLAYNFSDQEELLARLGAIEPHGEEGYTSLERIWHRPTLELTGVAGGFAGEGIKTVIAKTAKAKVAARLVPDQRPEVFLQLLEKHVAAVHPPACNVTIKALGFQSVPYSMPRDTPPNRAAAKVLRRVMGNEPKFIRGGATIPALASMQQHLGLDTTLFGFGVPGSNMHAPNEHFPLAMYELAREAYVRLYFELAARAAGGNGNGRRDEL